MTMLALINTTTNICENITLDDRPADQVQVPGYLVLDLSTTPAVDWVWDNNLNDWISVENVGNGGIGDAWDGQKLVQPHP